MTATDKWAKFPSGGQHLHFRVHSLFQTADTIMLSSNEKRENFCTDPVLHTAAIAVFARLTHNCHCLSRFSPLFGAN